jgi:hypothetical protein
MCEHKAVITVGSKKPGGGGRLITPSRRTNCKALRRYKGGIIATHDNCIAAEDGALSGRFDGPQQVRQHRISASHEGMRRG